MERGYYIAFEGVDGSGKSSVLWDVKATLRKQGYPIASFREPGTTALGEALREMVFSYWKGPEPLEPLAELFLFSAARAQVRPRMTEALAEGKLVLTDRSFLSTYAYQAFGRGLPWDQVKTIIDISIGALFPDCFVFLDLPPDHERVRIPTEAFAPPNTPELVASSKVIYDGYQEALARLEIPYLYVDASRFGEAEVVGIVMEYIHNLVGDPPSVATRPSRTRK